MGYASLSGRAKTSASNPRAHAICDRCGFRFNHIDLQWQYDYRGATLQNVRILVCPSCLDDYQNQLKSIVLPADPVPIVQPRVEWFTSDETDYRVTAAAALTDPTTGLPIPQGVLLATTDGHNRTTNPLGTPQGLPIDATAPLFENTAFGNTLSVLSMNGDGFYTITVTCSVPHGLSTGSQIAVQGALVNQADGAYSVVVTTATAFTYQTIHTITNGSIMGPHTAVWTTNVGVPYNYDQVPQTGV